MCESNFDNYYYDDEYDHESDYDYEPPDYDLHDPEDYEPPDYEPDYDHYYEPDYDPHDPEDYEPPDYDYDYDPQDHRDDEPHYKYFTEDTKEGSTEDNSKVSFGRNFDITAPLNQFKFHKRSETRNTLTNRLFN